MPSPAHEARRQVVEWQRIVQGARYWRQLCKLSEWYSNAIFMQAMSIQEEERKIWIKEIMQKENHKMKLFVGTITMICKLRR